jgi:hypothetical protein
MKWFRFYAQRILYGRRTDKDDRFSVEQSTIAKNRIYNFSHSINVRTIITPEHRYAKIMKEKLNEDGANFPY